MNEGRGERTTVVWATILLALKFIWRLMPADEVPSPMLNTLSILLELGMLIGVVGLVPRILRSLPEGAPRGGWIFLLVVAIVSGAGIFVIRLTGGPRVELPPRTSAVSTEAEEVQKQLRELIRSAGKKGDKFAASRWIQALAKQDPAEMRKLSRQDLQDARKLYGELREDIERVLKAFAQAESKRIDVSTASTEPGASRPETWQAALQGYNAFHEQLGLIEQHWDEWLADPFLTASSDLKPWQTETKRLSEIAAEASQQFHALTQPGASPSAPLTDAAPLAKRLQEAIDRFEKLIDRMEPARWNTLKKDPATAQTRTRKDLQDIREIFSQVHEGAEASLKIIAEAQSKGIDLAAFTIFGRPELWRRMEQIYKAGMEKYALIDRHWEEWKAQPEPADEKSMKPWQREIKRLDDVIDANLKEARAETEVAAVTPTAAPSRAPSPPGNNFDQLALQTHMLPAVGDYVIALKRVQATRWIKSPNANSYHPQKITRADLHDANEKLRNLIASIDKLRADLDAVTVPVPAAEKEYWRVKRETSVAFQQLTSLLEENWKEWHVSGIEPKTGGAKPWQKEASRLQGEIDKLKQIEQSSILL